MDLKQFNQFYNEKQGGFKRFAASYVHDEMTAEDVVSEVFAHYWDNRHILSEDANVAAYVLTVVKHKCLDYLRHHLPEQTRRIFEMSRYENLSYKEIALRLNISTKGVEFHITKALKVLRVALRDYLPFYLLSLI